MLDIEGIVLHKILLTGDLDNFSKLRHNFFSKLYTPIFREVYKYYQKFGEVPTFDKLIVIFKDPIQLESVHALRLLTPPDVPTELAVQSLIDKYMQDEALNGISKILNEITYYDSSEIKSSLGDLLLELDSKLNTDENVIYANQLKVFEEQQVSEQRRTPTGISNWIDANVGGIFEEDLVLIGGRVGAGKSLVCANLIYNQYQQGNVAVYFTIEMTGAETYRRMMSIMAQVNAKRLKLNKLTPHEDLALVRARAHQFEDAEHLVEDYLNHKDKFRFERELITSKRLKHHNQIIIIDDRELTIPIIDFTCQKLKAEHGDKFKLAVVDYLNQVKVGTNLGVDLYDWKEQMVVSKLLKNIARKNKIGIATPYQIDEHGVARLSKGILDAADLAVLLSKDEKSITFKGSKSRASAIFETRVACDWETLTIDPAEIPVDPPKEEDESDKRKSKLKRAMLGADDV